MKKFKFIICFALPLFVSCHTYQKGIVGEYESKTYNRIQQTYLMVFENTTFVLRSTLTIKNDSTYVLGNCGNIESGHWRLRHDSLLLFCGNNRYRIDSFNVTGFKGHFLDCGNWRPKIFVVHHDKLKRRYKAKDGKTVLYYFKKQI